MPLPGALAPVFHLERQVALPARVAAYFCAVEARRALPSSESLRHCGTAPLHRTGADTFEIAYQQNAAGRWFCAGDGELVPQPWSAPGVAFDADFAAGTGVLRRAEGGRLQLRIVVAPSGDGCRIDGDLRLLAAATLAHDIEAMLQLAVAERQGARLLSQRRFGDVIANTRATAADTAVGCSGPAPLLARCLVQQAVAHERLGQLRLAYAALRSARLADRELRGFELWSGRLAEQLGLDDAAGADFRLAVLVSDDAGVRSEANAGLQRLQQRQRQPGVALVAAASRQLASGRWNSAKSLLDRARAAAPDPARDLQCLRQLQLARGDTEAALATALLWREYAPSPLAERSVFESLRAIGADTLAARSNARLAPAPALASPPH